MHRIFLGWDPREQEAYDVAVASIQAQTAAVEVTPLKLADVQASGLYTRAVVQRDGRLWDPISEAPMSTEHAISRFLVPQLAGYRGWAVFADCDILVRRSLDELFALADPRYALQVVQHAPQDTGATKMDGQIQTNYARKWWSSVILWNCDHPAHASLEAMVNTLPGRDLHRFCWLADSEIGALPLDWNYLIGVSPPCAHVALAHFTLGIPSMPGYEFSEFADEWRAYATQSV